VFDAEYGPVQYLVAYAWCWGVVVGCESNSGDMEKQRGLFLTGSRVLDRKTGRRAVVLRLVANGNTVYRAWTGVKRAQHRRCL